MTGFENFKKGITEENEELINSCDKKINNAVKLVEDYNAALEKLADEKGVTIEY